ncbi:MAG TPA: ATP synthase F1 subunit delta [Gaiellales bacterium]|nr:ATP synthase F1 subunit delta [Gaiellales bacterium]
MAERIDQAARVYADALYAAARDGGRVREVDRALQALLAALAGNRPLLKTLVNPAVPREAKRRILARLLAEEEPLARNAVLVIADRGRLTMVADLAAAYAELAAAEERILTVEVTTAIALDDAQVEALRKRVADAVGREANVVATVDPEIIGGLVLKARGVLLDASVRRRLEDIRRALVRTPLPVGSEA